MINRAVKSLIGKELWQRKRRPAILPNVPLMNQVYRLPRRSWGIPNPMTRKVCKISSKNESISRRSPLGGHAAQHRAGLDESRRVGLFFDRGCEQLNHLVRLSALSASKHNESNLRELRQALSG